MRTGLPHPVSAGGGGGGTRETSKAGGASSGDTGRGASVCWRSAVDGRRTSGSGIPDTAAGGVPARPEAGAAGAAGAEVALLAPEPLAGGGDTPFPATAPAEVATLVIATSGRQVPLTPDGEGEEMAAGMMVLGGAVGRHQGPHGASGSRPGGGALGRATGTAEKTGGCGKGRESTRIHARSDGINITSNASASASEGGERGGGAGLWPEDGEGGGCGGEGARAQLDVRRRDEE